jgi:hypothetical protein
MAAGLVIGLFSASIVWAISSPKATTERLFSLLNGSFDENRLEHGFPHHTGFWSGDEAAIRDGQLRFIAPGSDSGDPTGRAISCDVFQLVDLRPLRHALSPEGDSVLELSADFLDARAPNSKPSVSFFGQLYLFAGDPGSLHQTWPQSIPEALASGSAQVTTLGSDAKGVRTLTAKCLIPAQADFAVIQISSGVQARLPGLFGRREQAVQDMLALHQIFSADPRREFAPAMQATYANLARLAPGQGDWAAWATHAESLTKTR